MNFPYSKKRLKRLNVQCAPFIQLTLCSQPPSVVLFKKKTQVSFFFIKKKKEKKNTVLL